MDDKGRAYADNELKKLEEELQREYSQALTDLKRKQREFMAGYKVELARMKERLAAEEITQKQFKGWQTDQLTKSKWYRDMLDTLTDDLVNVDQRAAEIVNGHVPGIYAESANWAAYEVEDMAEVSFTLVQPETVRSAIEGGMLEGELFAAVDVPKDKRWNRKHISSAITQGVLQGEGIPDIAKRLETAVGMDYRQAVRTARTAITGAENSGRMETYERAKGMGADVRKMWVATLDNRTRHSHRNLDREVVDTDKEFGNGCRFPGDPSGAASEIAQCRCTLVAVVDGYTYDDAERASKLGGMSYEDWKAAKHGSTKANQADRKGVIV